jgi:hypothetical protein
MNMQWQKFTFKSLWVTNKNWSKEWSLRKCADFSWHHFMPEEVVTSSLWRVGSRRALERFRFGTPDPAKKGTHAQVNTRTLEKHRTRRHTLCRILLFIFREIKRLESWHQGKERFSQQRSRLRWQLPISKRHRTTFVWNLASQGPGKGYMKGMILENIREIVMLKGRNWPWSQAIQAVVTCKRWLTFKRGSTAGVGKMSAV